jgi:hypothetical protein
MVLSVAHTEEEEFVVDVHRPKMLQKSYKTSFPDMCGEARFYSNNQVVWEFDKYT